MKNLSRRNFLRYGSLMSLISSALPLKLWSKPEALPPLPFAPEYVSSDHKTWDLSVYIFSKHLHFLDYQAMSEACKEMGFAGLDLTIRPDGHVNPQKVEEDLPLAVEAMKKQGLDIKIFTSSITNTDGNTQNVLKTAAKLGFSFYRTGWLGFPEDKSIPETLEIYKKQFKELTELNRSLGICGSYQNHAGNYMGAAIWDLWEILKDQDTSWLGIQYDVRHASVEGSNSWYQNLRLIQNMIKNINVKDFIWKKGNKGWVAENVPLGEGAVDFVRYFKFLQKNQIRVPVSLHIEYPLGGAEEGKKQITIPQKEVFQAMKRDLQTLRMLWEKASEG